MDFLFDINEIALQIQSISIIKEEKFFKLAFITEGGSGKPFLVKIYQNFAKFEKAIRDEILFLESFKQKNFLSHLLLNYKGFKQVEPKPGSREIMLIFEYTFFLREFQNVASKNLMQIFESLIRNLASLQMENIYLLDFQFSDICCPSPKKFKFLNYLKIDESEKKTDIHPIFFSENKYRSPELMLFIRSKGKSATSVNPFKSACFSLGLIFMEIVLGPLENIITGMEELKLNLEIKKCFQRLKSTLETFHFNDKNAIDYCIQIIARCLNFSQDARPDFWELFLFTLKPRILKENEIWKRNLIISLQEITSKEELANFMKEHYYSEPEKLESKSDSPKEKEGEKMNSDITEKIGKNEEQVLGKTKKFFSISQINDKRSNEDDEENEDEKYIGDWNFFKQNSLGKKTKTNFQSKNFNYFIIILIYSEFH